MDRSIHRQAFAVVLAMVLLLGGAARRAPAGQGNQTGQEARVAALIALLGAEDFSAREKAQGELAQLGLEAFDALHTAQNHHDPEIALRARYLVRSMSVRWFSESDSPEVVRILKGYGDLPEADRRNRLEKLAALEEPQGIVPLCRLSRFETVDPLAKYAALKIMEAAPPDDVAAKAERAKTIESIVGSGKRPAAHWLRLHARTLANPVATLADWDQATQEEQAAYKEHPERTTPEIVRDLHRYQVELLTRLNRGEEANAVIRRTYSLLVDAPPEQIQETVDWLRHREAWPLVVEVCEQFDASVQKTPMLLYRLAEAYEKLGQSDKAALAAKTALLSNPQSVDEHIRVADLLEEMPGLARFAEAEYREVLKNAPSGSGPDFKARFRLAELLHDQLQELPAAEILKPVGDLIKKDEEAKRTCERLGRDPDGVIARMHYFFASYHHEQGDAPEEKRHLAAAIEVDSIDADVLIAMYRFPAADEAWKAMTKEKIATAAQQFRVQIDGLRATVDTTGGEQSDTLRDLAIASNLYAWLVGNTFGDFDDAIKWSQESVKISQRLLDLKPHYPGFLDTLGRCYYAKGDLASAVKHQSLAVKLNPDSGQLRRQLKFFLQEAKVRGVKLPEAKGTQP